jgi:hypothetical protein
MFGSQEFLTAKHSWMMLFEVSTSPLKDSMISVEQTLSPIESVKGVVKYAVLMISPGRLSPEKFHERVSPEILSGGMGDEVYVSTGSGTSRIRPLAGVVLKFRVLA